MSTSERKQKRDEAGVPFKPKPEPEPTPEENTEGIIIASSDPDELLTQLQQVAKESRVQKLSARTEFDTNAAEELADEIRAFTANPNKITELPENPESKPHKSMGLAPKPEDK